jgi:hypothetical protein
MEQLRWLHRFRTVAELDRVLRDFAHRFNNHWFIGQLGVSNSRSARPQASSAATHGLSGRRCGCSHRRASRQLERMRGESRALAYQNLVCPRALLNEVIARVGLTENLFQQNVRTHLPICSISITQLLMSRSITVFP